MSQIVVENNKVKYTPLREGIQGSFEQQQGTHLFGQPLSSSSSHITKTYTLTSKNSENLNIQTLAYPITKYIIHGTITKNITDDILYYLLWYEDRIAIISANPYNIIDNVNITSYTKEQQQYINCMIYAVNNKNEYVNNVDIKIDFITDTYAY